jgi:hypothetical protein
MNEVVTTVAIFIGAVVACVAIFLLIARTSR